MSLTDREKQFAELAVAMSHTINYDSINKRAEQIIESGVSKEDLAATVGIIRAVNAGVQLREAIVLHNALGSNYGDELGIKAMLDKTHAYPGLTERENTSSAWP